MRLSVPSFYCIFYFYGNSVVNINRSADVCVNDACNVSVYISADNVNTLGGILALTVVLDYKQPYSYGTDLYPKQL